MKEDLVYADSQFREQQILGSYVLDMAIGADENTFELKVPLSVAIPYGSYIYYNEREWGGVVDSREIDTTTDKPKYKYSGRTWHGILEHSIIRPDPGKDYLTYSGDVHSILAMVVKRQGLSNVFAVEEGPSGFVTSGRFDRYIRGFKGLRNLCKSAGCKLRISKTSGGLVTLSAVEAPTYEIDSDHMAFLLQEHKRPVNHLVCLGKGDLANRTVIDLYADAQGRVSKKQTFFGVDEVAEIYDYPNADDESLEKQGTEKLLEYQDSDYCGLVLDENLTYEIDDGLHAMSNETDVEISASVEKIIVGVDEDEEGYVEISYEVGNVAY